MSFNKAMPAYVDFNCGAKGLMSFISVFVQNLSKWQYNKILITNLAQDKEAELSFKFKHFLHLKCFLNK